MPNLKFLPQDEKKDSRINKDLYFSLNSYHNHVHFWYQWYQINVFQYILNRVYFLHSISHKTWIYTCVFSKNNVETTRLLTTFTGHYKILIKPNLFFFWHFKKQNFWITLSVGFLECPQFMENPKKTFLAERRNPNDGLGVSVCTKSNCFLYLKMWRWQCRQKLGII